MDAVTAVSLALGIAGVLGTVYYGRKSLLLEKRLTRFDWADVVTGVRYLVGRTEALRKTDLILSLSGPGSIVSNLLITQSHRYVPLYIGVSVRNDQAVPYCLPQEWQTIRTTKWTSYVPAEVFRHTDRRVLICDDVAISGDTLMALVELLLAHGFKRANIRTAVLFATDVAIAARKGPDLYWMKISDGEFYLPWGNALGRGY
jgi:hypoxanthine phosphoribosyltransferase